MAAVAPPRLMRHLLSRRCQSAGIRRSPQRRWARVHDVRFLATHHQANERVTDRYKAKLEQKVREKGLSDISELKDAYKDSISNLRKAAAVPGATAPLNYQSHHDSPSGEAAAAAAAAAKISSTSPWPSPPPPPSSPPASSSPLSDASGSQKTPPGVKTLSSFIDIPKILELPPKEIEGIWRLRHAGKKGSLCASIPAHTYNSIVKTARAHPQFILPGLPQQVPPAAAASDEKSPSEHTQTQDAAEGREGAVIHFLQWTFPTPDTATVMFTHLAEYKLRGEFSQPHTTITHHLELAGPKGLVLCQGSVIEGRGVSVEEARWLVMCLQKFYNTTNMDELAQSPVASPLDKELNGRRRRLMEQFSSGDSTFSVQQLLEETERLG